MNRYNGDNGMAELALILAMKGGGGTAVDEVSGTAPSVTAKPNRYYLCGEVTTLALTLETDAQSNWNGIYTIQFGSGTTPTVLNITDGEWINWANGFDPTSLEENKIYELSIAPSTYGLLGVACSWDYAESEPAT